MSSDTLEKDIAEIKAQVREIRRQLSDINAVLSQMQILPSRTEHGEQSDWAALADKSFAFWNNDEDAVYDGL